MSDKDFQDALDAAYVALLLSSEITPGEWESFYKRKYDEWHVSIPMRDSLMRLALCSEGVAGHTLEERQANAQAIAAVPQMMRALRQAFIALRGSTLLEMSLLLYTDSSTRNPDLARCREILAQGVVRGFKPSANAIERMME